LFDNGDVDVCLFVCLLVSSTGLECGVCKSNCTGCVVKPDDNPICLPRKDKVITLSIDWEQNMLDNFYDDEEAMVNYDFFHYP
jgi:hypothetical protein